MMISSFGWYNYQSYSLYKLLMSFVLKQMNKGAKSSQPCLKNSGMSHC